MASSYPFPDPEPPSLFAGLDLGQAHDFAALALLHKQPTGVLHLRALSRKRGRSYPKVVRDVAAFLGRPGMATAALAVDMTGPGRPVMDLLWEALPGRAVLGVTATSGSAVTSGGPGCVNIPKRVLVSTVLVLLQGRRLEISTGLDLADVLVRELTNFRLKITANANETFEGEGTHDDLVFAAALACWLAENWKGPYLGPLVYSAPRGELPEVKRPENWREALADLNIDLDGEWGNPAWPWC